MTQNDLFESCTMKVFKDLVDQIGGAKVVGHALWPDKPVDKAEERLLNVLNPNKRDVLDPISFIKLLRMGSEKGCHTGMYHVCGEALYRNPDPVTLNEAATEVAIEIREEANSAVTRIDKRLEKLERLLSQT